VVLCFQSVSEAGRQGVEELESQTGQLLSFQGMGQPVFDTQVAFNLLDRFGPGSKHKLSAVRERLRAETKSCIGKKSVMPALQLIHAPVFYGTAFSACAELVPGTKSEQIVAACEDAGFVLPAAGEAGPGNVSVAGEKVAHLAKPEEDPARPGAWWFWGAADNIRCPRGQCRQAGGDAPMSGARLLPLILSVAGLLSGCGYRVAGHNSSLPKSIHTIAVPALENKTTSYRLEQKLTAATVHEFLAKTSVPCGVQPGGGRRDTAGQGLEPGSRAAAL